MARGAAHGAWRGAQVTILNVAISDTNGEATFWSDLDYQVHVHVHVHAFACACACACSMQHVHGHACACARAWACSMGMGMQHVASLVCTGPPPEHQGPMIPWTRPMRHEVDVGSSLVPDTA